MSLQQKLKHELKALTITGLFFAVWISALLVLKDLLLAEYDIAFHGWSVALVGALTANFKQADVPHVWINTIVLSGALFGYNALTVIRRHLGEGGLLRLFLKPLPVKVHPAVPRDERGEPEGSAKLR